MQAHDADCYVVFYTSICFGCRGNNFFTCLAAYCKRSNEHK